MKVLIVDDEPRARNRLARLLRSIKGIDLCGLARDGAEALETLEREKPDLVLLDVQMPGLDGFEVVNELRGDSLPLIVFVTAYDQYALRAFEVSAVDYLLKPVSEERLRQAVAKADKILQSSSAALTGVAEQYAQIAAALAAVHRAICSAWSAAARIGSAFFLFPTSRLFLSKMNWSLRFWRRAGFL